MEDMNNEAQALLFGSSNKTRLFFITTQRNLMSFLGAGMILPSGAQFRYKEDDRENYGGAIPFWKAGVPSFGAYNDALKDERVVIVECHADDVVKYGGRYIAGESDQLVVINAPVPLQCVSSFYMISQAIIDDFVMRVPDDVILDKSVFSVIKNIDVIDFDKSEDLGPIKSVESQLTFIDSLGGGVKALHQFISDDIADYTYIRDLLDLCLNAYGSSFLASGGVTIKGGISRVSSSDKAIFLALLPILRDIKLEDGFDPILILEHLILGLERQSVSHREDIKTWVTYVKKAVEAEIEVPELADKKDIFKRGVLLFLLRPSLDRLENSKQSSILPGSSVLSIAAFLSGFTCGLTRMGSKYKGDYRQFNRFTKSLLDALWCKSKLELSVVRELNIQHGMTELYEVNKEVLFELDVQQNAVLARVLNQAKSIGFDLHYDYDHQELFYEFDMGGDRKQMVYVELITPLAKGIDVIRFVSPCLDLSGKNHRALKKDVAIDFLKRNCEDTMYCAFAYSARRKAIVVEAMQIVKTMDDDEFSTLIKYVAKVADDYEKDVLGQDRY